MSSKPTPGQPGAAAAVAGEPEETIKIDLTGLTAALKEAQADQIKLITEALLKREGVPQGKGYVTPPETAKKLVESIRNVKSEGWRLAEQWTVAVPNYTTKELGAHLRDHVWVTEILKGEQGDVANIPYVMDFDFSILGSVGAAFAATIPEASLIGSVTTTLYEAGAYSDISYYLLERFDSNLLEQLNAAFANAAVRAEDQEIMTLVDALTGTNYAGGYAGGATNANAVGRGTGSAYFYAANIPAAMGKLLATGKAVRPSECLLYMTANAYKALLEELVASQVIAYAVPSVITQGLVEVLFGVKIVVGGYRTYACRNGAATGTVDLCYLMRSRRAIALAPKRDILIETDKQIAVRKLRITGSHTFGVKILSGKEIVRIWTSRVAA